MGKWPKAAAVFLIGWYLLLAFTHYLYARPLWLDEQWVFANINERSPQLLFTQALLHDQAFPRLYLALISFLAKPAGYYELALRLLPFLSMLGAFLCWTYIARRRLSEGAFLLFLLCWAVSGPLIYYAAELKQYSMDVLVVVLFLLFFCYGHELRQKTSAVIYGASLAVLALTPLFSYAAFFVVLFPLYNMLLDAKAGKDGWGWPLFYGGCLVAVFSVVYQIDLRHADSSRMVTYWGEYMISYESPLEFIRTVQEGCNNLISRWFALKPKWIRMASRLFIGIGFIYLLARAWASFKKDGGRFRSVEAVSAGALLMCFILSVLKKFPFVVPRMYLFMAPVLFFMTAEAFEWISKRNMLVYRAFLFVFVIFLLIVGAGIAQMSLSGQLTSEPELWR